MQVFISWSGDRSREVASEIKTFIPKVLQAVKPYYTPKDIEKGRAWLESILTKLNECVVGIICVTPENVNSAWINFEAGALSNRAENAIVAPLLFNVSKADLSGPMSMFQMTVFNQEDFRELLVSINNSLPEKVPADVLNESFEAFYPKLEEKITTIMEGEIEKNEKVQKKRGDREILEEILELTRNIVRDQQQSKAQDQFYFQFSDVENLKKRGIKPRFNPGFDPKLTSDDQIREAKLSETQQTLYDMILEYDKNRGLGI